MKVHRIIAIAAAAVLAVPTYSSAAASETIHRIVGYLPDWNYRPFSELDLSQLTNINIAFCNPDENGSLYCNIPESKLKTLSLKLLCPLVYSVKTFLRFAEVILFFVISYDHLLSDI